MCCSIAVASIVKDAALGRRLAAGEPAVVSFVTRRSVRKKVARGGWTFRQSMTADDDSAKRRASVP